MSQGVDLNYGFLSDMLGLELRKAQIQAEKKFDQVFGKKLLPGHYTVLVLIKNNPGSTQTAIAQSAGLDRSSLVPLLKQFEERGLIVRKKAKRDARSNITVITPAGEAFILENQPKIEALEQALEKNFGSRRYKELVAALKELQTYI
jgi:DNA-binding MarR family transcriptional regulator